MAAAKANALSGIQSSNQRIRTKVQVPKLKQIRNREMTEIPSAARRGLNFGTWVLELVCILELAIWSFARPSPLRLSTPIDTPALVDIVRLVLNCIILGKELRCARVSS